MSTNVSYCILTIDETAADDDFGDYYQASARYAYSKALSVGIYAAMIDSGKAFDNDADTATEFFREADFKF